MNRQENVLGRRKSDGGILKKNQKQMGSSGSEMDGLQRGTVRDGAIGSLRAWRLSKDSLMVP